MKALYIDQHQGVVASFTITELAMMHLAFINDVLAHIIYAPAAFINGFPDHGLVRGSGGVGEWLVLHPDGAPHIVFGIENGNVGVISAML